MRGSDRSRDIVGRQPTFRAVRCAAVGLALMSGLLSGPAPAQEPLQLLPPHLRPDPTDLRQSPPPASTEPPDRAAPAPWPDPSPPVPAQVNPPEPPSEPVVRPQLRQPVPPVIGLVGQIDGGLPVSMWDGSEADQVQTLLSRLPVATQSVILSDLRRRLVLSEQRPPAGLSPADLLRLRLALLDRQGAAADTVERLGAPLSGDADADAVRLRAHLIEGQNRIACAMARAPAPGGKETLWLKAQIYCDLVEKRTGRALLGLSMLREMAEQGTGTNHADAFFRLAERQAGAAASISGSLRESSVPSYAMLRLDPDLNAPWDALRSQVPWTARSLALGPNGPPGLRALAAEQAAAAGALDRDGLAETWRQTIVDPRDLATAVSRVMQGGTAADRALAFAILSGSSDPDRLRGGLPHVLETSRAETPNLHALHADLYAPIIARLDPAAPDTPPFAAATLVRALLVAGRLELASAWLAALERRAAEGHRDAEDAVAVLWPLHRLAANAGSNEPLSSDRLLLWRQALALRLGESPSARQALDRAHARVLTLLDAAGLPVSEALWQALNSRRAPEDAVTETQPQAVAADLQALDDAATAGRIGETVARVLIVMGDDGPAETPIHVLARVVAALRGVGLSRDAGRLALAALLAEKP